MTQSNSLKPCPFCGGEADDVLTDYPQVQVDEVRCRNCDASVGGGSEAEAIAAWNTRPAAKAAPQADGALREEVRHLILEHPESIPVEHRIGIATALSRIDHLASDDGLQQAALRANLPADGGTHSADNGGSK